MNRDLPLIMTIAAACAAPGLFAQDKPVAAPASVWEELEAKAAAAPAIGYDHSRAAILARPMWKEYYAKYADWKAPERPPLPNGKLRNLGEKPAEPRFPLTGKDWPAQPGEASVCLWEDDKTAAASFSIDDNFAPEIPKWEEISKNYGDLKITWNVITNNIDGVVDPGRGKQAGTWELWQELLGKGFRVESHSVTHVGNPVLEDGWPGPDWECAESIRQLEANLPGMKAKLWTPPGSAIKAFNISYNWRESAVKYYAAARGFSGIAINRANMTDYFDIRTTANPSELFSEDPKHAPGNFNNILNADPNSPHYKYYRGWATVFIHGLGGDANIANNPNPITASFAKVFEFFNQNQDEIWVGFIGDIALYGQERDTAKLTTDSVTDREIKLTLTSQMDPEVFDYPLTIKVRLPAPWKTAAATSQGAALPCQLIQHEGAAYALVKVVPDRGQISLTP